MFVAIFAYNVNSCALDISLYFVCEKKTNKSWHRKKSLQGTFSDWSKTSLFTIVCTYKRKL